MLRRVLFVLALLAVVAQQGGEVRAACSRPNSPGVFAKESITVSSTSIGFTSATFAPSGADPAYAAYVTIETDAVRWWADGTAPTAAVGHHLPAGQAIEICGTDNVRNFRMIRVTADATARVSLFR